MSSSVFGEKSKPPDDRRLSEALGETFALWTEIRSSVSAEIGGLVTEWKYYGPKSGWIMKSLNKKRNLFFLTPCDGFFRLGFVFGDKAVAAIERSGLPKAMIDEVKNAKRYVEGRGLRVEVRMPADVAAVKTLVAIKIAN